MTGRLLVALLTSLALGCSATQDSSEGPLPPGAAKPVLDSEGMPQDCQVMHEGLCYQKEADACRAAGCEPGACIILESYPGQVECQAASPSTDATGP